MKEFETNQLFVKNEDVEVLSLPYKDNSYAFNIFLPKNRLGLKKLRLQLSGVVIRNLLSRLKLESMTISIPKMKIDTNYELKEALMVMGVTDIFSKQRANLLGISEQSLYVSDAAHRALIEVDEKGTTAAAATYFRIWLQSRTRKQPRMFIANHPFLFILSKDMNPFFIGQYA
ncbi:unnamed protein product [Cylicostephanus goldi]|uniref:Serpin domain-containing protein n=1 Tax=Cylicostephanus goldi TaxID=71465 RepID=A0A3P6RGJ0_CYLGO|nr:unnamed protein product [Cylicostephanus goldi]